MKDIIGGNWQNPNMDLKQDYYLIRYKISCFWYLHYGYMTYSPCPQGARAKVLGVKGHDICDSLSNTGGYQTTDKFGGKVCGSSFNFSESLDYIKVKSCQKSSFISLFTFL